MIAQIANDLFYENYLMNGVKAQARKSLVKEFQPVTFISAEKGLVSLSQLPLRLGIEERFLLQELL